MSSDDMMEAGECGAEAWQERLRLGIRILNRSCGGYATPAERIKKYGFVIDGKKVLIG